MKEGKVKSHVDTMIAAIALAGGHILISRDDDFKANSDVFGLNFESC